jgi:PAS domain S-box-containing protein
MSPFLKKLLSLRKMAYLMLDQDFNILETSLGVQRFADRPNEVIKGKDVRLGFPELIGIEDILNAIFQGQQESFELKGIGRFSTQDTPLYIDISIINSQDEEELDNRLIIFFEDVTEKMIMEQKLVQNSNEISLLLEAWSCSNNYLDYIIKSLKDVLLIITSSKRIKIVNLALQDLLEYSREELISQPISMIIDEENTLIEANDSASLLDEVMKNFEVVCQTKTGKRIAIAFSKSIIQTDSQGLHDFIYIGREIIKPPISNTYFL